MAYNPFIYDSNTAADGSTVEVTVLRCSYIRLYPVSGNATVHINDTGNTPPFILYESTDLENKDGQIDSLHISSTGATTTNVKMVDYPASEIVRAGI